MNGESRPGGVGDRPPIGDGQRVLVVTGDPELGELLGTTLELAQYQVETVGSGIEMVQHIIESGCDLVVLDTTLPHLDSLRSHRLAESADLPPVLFLAGPQTLHSLLPSLGQGQKDYVSMPLRVSEVLIRVQLLLHSRNPFRSNGQACYRDLVLDDATCQARRGPQSLDLTAAEYRLLHHLLVNAEHVLSKEQISRHVWGEFRADNAIEKLVSRLRGKVDQQEPALIHTRRGFGYWFGATSR